MKSPRLIVGCALALIIATSITALLAWAEAGSAAEIRCSVPLTLWFGCAIGKHENLAGGLLAAGGALFAAWIAWVAVQAQIESERQLTKDQIEAELRLLTANEDANYAAALETLREVLEFFRLLFVMVTFAIRADETTIEKWVGFIRMNVHLLPKEPALARVRAMSQRIGARRRSQLEGVLEALTQVRLAAEKLAAPTDEDTQGTSLLHRLNILLVAFEYLEAAVQEFDPKEPAWFARKEATPRKTSNLEQMRSGLFAFLEQEDIRKGRALP